MKLPDKSFIQRQPALSEQLYEHLSVLIQDGTYQPGEIFPSETELANSMDVSRPVVREALTRMKHDGLLESRKGGRTHVALDISGLSFRIDANAHEEEHYLAYLYEMRAIIEPEAASLAAMRATPQAIGNIKKRFQALEKALKEGKDGTDESLEFHKSVIDASGNPHLAKFINWVGKKVWAFIRSHDLDQNCRMLTRIQKEHGDIIEAIEKKDSPKARNVSRKHVLNAAKQQGIEIVLPR